MVEQSLGFFPFQNSDKRIIFWLLGVCLTIVCFLLVIYLIFFRPSFSSTPDISMQKPSSSSPAFGEGLIYIDISGAVKNPGLYHVSSLARVADVLKQAGGLRSDADLKYVGEKLDLAKKLKDEEMIYVPFQGQSWKGFSQQDANGGDLLSVNGASASQLQDLPGVSKKKALLFVNNRPYSSLKDFQQKNKLSVGFYQKIENLISL